MAHDDDDFPFPYAPPPQPGPVAPPPPSAPMVGDLAALQRQRQADLQALTDRYEVEQRQIAGAHREHLNQRDWAHLNLMAQIPKVIGAVVAGALLAYLLPLGEDR